MSRRISLRRLSLGCAIALSLSAGAGAQEGEDHAAHHGAGMPAGGGMSAPASSGSSDMAKMMNPMMDRMINGEGENEHGHESRRTGFISQLLAFPALDEAALQAAHEKLAALKIHPREQTENRTLLARAERLYTQRLGDERQAIGHRIAIFTAALDSQDKRLIREAAQELQDYLNLMDDAPWD